MNKNILVIEDDTDIREGIKVLLEGEGYEVTEAAGGKEGIEKFSKDVSLIILDIMLPGMSGLQVCEKIRKISYVPILFLTAKAEEKDKLLGFSAGGDDYLVKPFSYTELFARVKALLRRHQIYDEALPSAHEETWVEKASLRICTTRNEVYLDSTEIKLTEIEYRMLLLFMSYPNKTFSIQNIYNSIWDEPFLNSAANTIMVHIRNLRTKIEKDPQKPKIIQTVWGKGYRFGETAK